VITGYYILFLFACATFYCGFRLIAWVIKNGWRSMLGLAEKRDEAIAGEVFCTDLDVADQPDPTAQDFELWTAEISTDQRIQKYTRRMDRWSS
jgi:hypothetical protein